MHATGQRSIRFESAAGNEQMKRAMAALREAPPTELAGAAVTAVHDVADGSSHLPPADVVVLELHGIETRVIVRPSGTEPKMKVYAEAVVAPGDRDDGGMQLRSARVEARTRITQVLDAAVRHVADPERHEHDRAPAATGGSHTGATAARPADLSDATRADDLRLVVRCTDLTTLEGDDTPGRIRALCSQAVRPDPADPTVGPVAAVCVYPALAGLAAELLAGTPVAVASVAGAFPSGLSPLDVRVAEVRAAVAAGAQEIDTVLNRFASSGIDDGDHGGRPLRRRRAPGRDQGGGRGAHRRRRRRIPRHRALGAGRGLAGARPSPLRRLQPADRRDRRTRINLNEPRGA